MRRRRSAASGEFEDRQEVPAVEGGIPNSQRLGDLTDDILYERGELDIPAGQKIPAGMPGAPGNVHAGYPPDVGYQDKVRETADVEGVKGTLSQGATVRTVYDARPINSRDFFHTDNISAIPANT